MIFFIIIGIDVFPRVNILLILMTCCKPTVHNKDLIFHFYILNVYINEHGKAQKYPINHKEDRIKQKWPKISFF